MARMLKGRKALLLAEGCKLRKQGKAIDERLKEIKGELDFVDGVYRNEAGDELVVSDSEKYSEISPRDVLMYLKRKQMSNRFPEVVKVQITALRKVVPDSMVDKWRNVIDHTYRWTWK